MRDLVTFVQFKKHEKNQWRSAKFCNYTKSNTPPWVFFTFFKLQKLYQIAQSITYVNLVLSSCLLIYKHKYVSRELFSKSRGKVFEYSNRKIYVELLIVSLVTHLFPMYPFSTICKQKTLRFSDLLRS